MDERLMAILDPAGTIGKAMAQTGLMDHQKQLIGVMESAGAGQLSRDEQMASNAASRIFGRLAPGIGYVIGAAEAEQAVKRSHREGIEQMEKRGVPGFETGTLQLENPRGVGENITMRYWTDVSAVEFGGDAKTYLEPADAASKAVIDFVGQRDNESAQSKMNRLEGLAGDVAESRALEGVHNAIGNGQNYGGEVSRGLQNIRNDYNAGRLNLSSVESEPQIQVAQAEMTASYNLPSMKI